MVVLNPIEQNISDITVFSSSNQAITQRFVNVLIKTNATSSFTINGNPPTISWQNFAALPGYSYLLGQPFPSTGSYHLSADSGFNAIAYGYGANESYAYSAGTNVKDLYTTTGVSTQYGILSTPNVCTGAPFKFKVSLPYCADSITWDLHNLPNPPVPSTITVHYSTCTPGVGGPDSSVVINGVTVNWYSLPNFYNIGTVGVDTINLTTFFPSGDCGSSQNLSFPLTVSNPPTASFSYTSDGCVATAVQFNETTAQLPYPTYVWWWNFGDPASGAANNTSNLKNPTHTFSAPGTYIVKYAAITASGCLTDTISQNISVTNVPIAKFGTSIPICDGKPITFSDTSSLNGFGTITTYNWNFGDGTVAIRYTNTDTTHIYTPWNPSITVALTVQSSSGCTSLPFTKILTVNPNPIVDFTLPGGICLPADSARFINNTTLADGSTSFNFLWNFGDVPSGVNNTSTLTNPAHYYNNAGPFTITLNATSAAGCVGNTASKVLSNVYAQAHANFSVNAQNCLNDTTYFNDNSNGSGNTVTTYHWDFGDASPDVNIANPWHVYATPGVKTIKHWVNTNVGCTSDTISHTVTINALPTANFNFIAPTCATRVINFIDASIANSGVVNNWQWAFGDGGTAIVQNTTNIYVASGTYTVTLKVTTDKGCVSNSTSKTIVINNRPQAGFIIPEVCLNDTQAQFVDTSKLVGGAINQWLWNFGDPNATIPNPNTSTIQNATHKYTATGAYNVQLVVGNTTTGCKDTITQVIFVNGSFPQSNFIVNTPTVLCGNDSVYIKDSSTVFPGTITKVQIYWDNVGTPTVFDNDDFPYF